MPKKARSSSGPFYVVFCDGNCSGNGKSAIARAGSGVFCANPEIGRVKSPVPGRQTNNRAELWAMALSLNLTLTKQEVLIRTDSLYVINGLLDPRYMAKWKKNGWRTSAKKPVLNSDLWMILDDLLTYRLETLHLPPPEFKHVRGHNGVLGNETADQLAREVIANKGRSLTREELEIFPFEYHINLDKNNDNAPLTKIPSSSQDKVCIKPKN